MRHKLVALAGLVSGLAFIAIQAAAAPDPVPARAPADPKPAVRRWIEAGNAQWMDGFRRADAAPVAESFAEDAVNVGADGTADRGRDAIRSRMAAFLQKSGPASEARVEIGEIVVDGDLAYEWGRSDAKFSGKNGGPARRVGRYLTCWKKQADGSWKIFRNNSLPD